MYSQSKVTKHKIRDGTRKICVKTTRNSREQNQICANIEYWEYHAWNTYLGSGPGGDLIYIYIYMLIYMHNILYI